MKLKRLVSPRTKVKTKIVQATTGFHNTIPKARLPTAVLVTNNAIALDPTNSVLNANTDRSNPSIDVLIPVRKGLTSGFLLGLNDLHISKLKALKTSVLEQNRAIREMIGSLVSQFLVVHLAGHRLG